MSGIVSSTAYPAELVDCVTLADRRRVRVRPLRRREDEPVRELHRRLSARTRYLRFFSEMPVLPDAVLRLLTCVDYQRRLALLAEVETPEGVEVVAMGSFAAIDDVNAEVGLVVRDDWQRRGIGIALALRVMRAAGVRGFDRFVAHTLWENRVVRKLLGHVGEIVATTTRHGVSEITFVRRGDEAVVRDRDLARALGRVLANEIGHVLLAVPKHDAAGLMRANFTAVDLAGGDRAPFRCCPTMLRAYTTGCGR